MQDQKQLSIVARVLSGGMLIFALGDMPYSYYQLLRIVVCSSSLFVLWYFIEDKKVALGWLFAVPAILFNPLAPIYLQRETWQLLDLVFAVAFFASLSVDTNNM